MSTQRITARPAMHAAIALLATLCGIVLAPAAPAHAFGTINHLGQRAEHEMITRSALACAPDTKSDGSCFEPRSMDELAGRTGTMGAVGWPDVPSLPDLLDPAAHCDNGDYLAVPDYPRDEFNPQTALQACVERMRVSFKAGIEASKRVLRASDDDEGEAGMLDGKEVDLKKPCNFRDGASRNAKCGALKGLGAALHGAQDFYAHSNWADISDPEEPISINNPPGLDLPAPSPVLDLLGSGSIDMREGLITGFFLSPLADNCPSTTDRVTHRCLAKDDVKISAITAAQDPSAVGVSDPQTPRGQIGGNARKAVIAAIVETRHQWEQFRDKVIRDNGDERGNRIISALTQDVPKVDVVFTVDTTGSMGADIATVKSTISDKLDELTDDRDLVDFRLAVVEFKDYWECPDDGFESLVDVPFTARKQLILDGLGFLEASGGCDYPESVYSGLMEAIRLKWRDGAKKAIILLGDAPPHDPEAFTGLTETAVVNAALAVDPAEIYALALRVGRVAHFEELATRTGGAYKEVSGAAEVRAAIDAALDDILSAPIANAGGPYTGFAENDIQFDASGSFDPDGSIVSYDWDFDSDGTYDRTTTEPLTAYAYPDAYAGDVSVRVTDDDGNATVGMAPVKIKRRLSADAGPDRSTQENGYVLLDASESAAVDGIRDYRWDFGDDTPPLVTTSPQIYHSYGRPGTFTAELTVSNGAGETATDTAIVTVSNTAPYVSVPYSFPRASVDAPRSYGAWVWTGQTEPTTVRVDFGDGTDAKETTVVGPNSPSFDHAYAAPGTYTVTFTAIDSMGERATGTGTVRVADIVANAGPDQTAGEGESVQLGGPDTTSPDAYTTVVWSFGDGSPDTSGTHVTHTYRDNGVYTATLRVADETTAVTSTAVITVENRAPSARMSVSDAVPGKPVSLRAFGDDPGADDVLSYRWEFGDGTQGTGDLVTHTFAQPGDYDVRLVVRDDDGGEATVGRSVAVRAAAPGSDSRGRDFWLAFPSNYTNAPQLTIYIAGTAETSGRVEVPGIGFDADFSVTPGEVTSVRLPERAQLSATRDPEHLGIHVTASQRVSVYGLNRIQATTDAYLGLPTTAIGTSYRVMSYAHHPSGIPSEAAVVATQNDTLVTITPRGSAVPFTVHLDLGDTYEHQSGDVTGTKIEADKPISVFGGHVCANVPANIPYCDHLVEQIPPTASWGRSFATMPLAGRTKGDTFRVLAANDATTVKVNGHQVATLDAGEFHEQIIDGPATIEADGPVLVTQYSNGTDFDNAAMGDPFMVMIPPSEQFQASYTVATPETGFRANYLNLVAPAAAAGEIAVDGTSPPASSYSQIGDSGMVGLALPVDVGSHRITSPLPLGVTVYGFDSYDSYGYPGGLGVGAVANVSTLRLTPATETLAAGQRGCVDAVAETAGGTPVADVRLDFTAKGANTASGFETTGQDGGARFCYTGDAVGSDTIEATLGAVRATASKQWTEPNRSPVAADDAVTVDAATANVIQASALLANDTDPDGDALEVMTVGDMPDTHGTVALHGSEITYTPASGYAGPAALRYTIGDGHDHTAQATVRLDVRAGNQPPVLDPVADRTVDEQTELAFALTATDPEGDALTYALGSAPAGAAVDASGRFSWTPTEAQGPETYAVTVKVADGAAAGRSSERTFSVRVVEVNRPPKLDAIADRKLAPAAALAVTARATDPDLPANHLAYALSEAPAGATIDPASGAIAWPAPVAGTHRFTVGVSDGGEPAGHDATSFSVVVESPVVVPPPPPPVPPQPPVLCGKRVVLVDVTLRGPRVRLAGLARTDYAGKTVTIAAGGRTVARARVASDGTFKATAARTSRSPYQRYQATVGGFHSLALKATRRLVIDSLRPTARGMRVSGHILGPHSARRTIVVARQLSCSAASNRHVRTLRTDARGRFSVDLAAPTAAERMAVYRVRTAAGNKTYTLPVLVHARG